MALDMKNHLIWKDIEHEVADEEERRYRFFSQWQCEKGSDANYKALISALLELNSQQDAEYVCSLLNSGTKEDSKGIMQSRSVGYMAVYGFWCALTFF